MQQWRTARAVPLMRRRDLTTLLFAGSAASTAALSDRALSQDPTASQSRSGAEIRAAVTPRRAEYREGDIRRYGASIDAPDNSAAINEALLVSANGGEPAFVPGGRWRITAPLHATLNCSMYGLGNGSVIAAEACDGLIFGSGGNYAVTGLGRFFRDFQIVGSNAADSVNRGVVVDFAARSKERVNAVAFENICIANFGTGAYFRGLWFSNLLRCHFYNCYCGIYFIGENCVNSIIDCTLNRGSIRGTGGAWGISFQSTDGESTQSTRIISGQVYFYDVLINVLLAFELQIEHCDLSAAQAVGVQIYGTIGGCWVRDCWIETTNSAPTVGIKVMNIPPSRYTCVRIVGNHLTCDTAAAGSQGISVGNANAGLIVNENAIVGFDRAVTLGASPHLVCKFNRLSCVTERYNPSSHAILLDSSATDSEIGPNEIITGKPQAAGMSAGNVQVRVSNSSSFPIGTPVEFDDDANGFFRGVTYFVLSSDSNVISVGAGLKGAATAANDNKPVNIFAAPLPLTLSRGTPRGLSFHGSGSFVMSLTGFSEGITGVMNWSASGRLLALSPAGAGSILGASNSSEMTAELPALLLPLSQQTILARVRDLGDSHYGAATITPSGSVQFFRTPGLEAFTRTGVKGIENQTLVYTYG